MENKIVVLITCPYARAQLIKGQLESEGIECFLSNINLVQPGISTGVQIKIRESDVDVAFKILQQTKHHTGLEKQAMVKKLKSIRRILVPVDFSSASLNASYFALELAYKLNAEIKLLYSYYEPLLSSGDAYDNELVSPYVSEFLSNMAYDARRHLLELKAELQKLADKKEKHRVKISSSYDMGFASEVIIQYEKSYDPGLIVMGTQGVNSSSGKYMGSSSLKVIQQAKAPVLVIPEDAKVGKSLEAQHVLYATNFEPGDQVSLRKLLTLVRPFKMPVHCVHIAQEGYSPFDSVRMDALDQQIKDAYPEFDIRCEVISQKDVILGLQNYIVENKIKLIAMTTHKRGVIERFFNPGISRKMLFHTEVPLLVFHD